MDDLQKEEQAINAQAEENSTTESPTVEETTSEVEGDSVQPEKTEQSTEGTDTKDERKVSGAEKRIHKLVDEKNQYKQQVEDLSSRLAELTAQPQQEASMPQYGQTEEQGGERELTLDDLRTIARTEVYKEQTLNRIRSEGVEAIRKYPELDITSDAFDADVNEAVTSAVENELKNNYSQSVIKLTDKYMKPYLKAAERAVGQEKQTLAKQVSETALRPSNVKGNDKRFQDKSIEEMEAELEIVH